MHFEANAVSRVDDPIGEVLLKFWLLAVGNVDHD